MGGGTAFYDHEGPHIAGPLHGQHVQVLKESEQTSVSKEVVNLSPAPVGETRLQATRTPVPDDAPVTLTGQMLTPAAEPGALTLVNPETSSVLPAAVANSSILPVESGSFIFEDDAVSSGLALGSPATQWLVVEGTGSSDDGNMSMDFSSFEPQSVTSTELGEPTQSPADCAATGADETLPDGSELLLPDQAVGGSVTSTEPGQPTQSQAGCVATSTAETTPDGSEAVSLEQAMGGSVTSTEPGEPTQSQTDCVETSTGETTLGGSQSVLPEQGMGGADLGPERLLAPKSLKKAVQQMIVQAKIVHSGDELPAVWMLLRKIERISGGRSRDASVDALWASLNEVESQGEVEGLQGASGCQAGAEVARSPAEKLVAAISERLVRRLKLKMKWDNIQKVLVTAGVCGAVATGGAVALLASASATVASFGFWGSLMYPAAAQAAVAAEAAAATAVSVSGWVACESLALGVCRNFVTLSPSVNEYKKMLQAMVQILPAKIPAEEGNEKVKEELSPQDLEDAIIQRWQSLGYGLEDQVDLKRLGGQVLTDESLNELLLRIRLLVAIRQLAEAMSHTAFVAVVGPQNVGKSTLIKRAGSLLGRDLEVTVGARTHTQSVRGYALHPRLWLVDFPGLNDLTQDTAEMWQGFCELPSLCVLLLPFKGGHPDADDVQLYCQVAGRLAGVELLVVVNKADSDLDEEETTAEELEECKAAYCFALGCGADSLAFASVRPKTLTSTLSSLGIWDARKVCCRMAERAAAVIGGDEELNNVFSA